MSQKLLTYNARNCLWLAASRMERPPASRTHLETGYVCGVCGTLSELLSGQTGDLGEIQVAAHRLWRQAKL